MKDSCLNRKFNMRDDQVIKNILVKNSRDYLKSDVLAIVSRNLSKTNQNVFLQTTYKMNKTDRERVSGGSINRERNVKLNEQL